VSKNRREEIESPPRLERVQARTGTRPLCESESRYGAKDGRSYRMTEVGS